MKIRKFLFTPPRTEEIIENAFKRMKKVNIAKGKNFWEWQKKKEIAKLKTFSNYIEEILRKIVKESANFEELHPFHKELLSILADVITLKKSLARVNESAKLVKKLSSKLLLSIRKTPCKGRDDFRVIKKKAREFLGRISSIVKRLKRTIELLRNASISLREMPDVNFSMPTAVLAGYPNVGKSTLLKRLTKAKPKIASYPFTTTIIQLGIIKNKEKIQLVDTPGLLDKPEEKRNLVEKKAVSALKHLANLIIFVFDPNMDYKKQLKLLKQIEKISASILIFISKTDISKKEKIEELKEKLKKYKAINAGFDVKIEDLRNAIKEMLRNASN